MAQWQPRDERYSINWQVTLTSERDTHAREVRIFNISRGGLGLLSQEPFAPGSKLTLSMSVPLDISEKILLPNPMQLHVEVQWCRELLDVNQVGTKYVFLNPVIRRALENAFVDFSSNAVKSQKGTS